MTDKIKSRDNWSDTLFGVSRCFDEKDFLITSYLKQLFRITLNMFIYKGLEDNEKTKHITTWDIEKVIQELGYVTFYEKDDKLYPDYSSQGGYRKWNYTWDSVIVNNPYLKFNKTLKVDEECILIKNDSAFQGLRDLNLKYATLLAECDTSIYLDTIISRAMYILFAKDSETAKTAKDWLENLIKGKIGVIETDNFIEELQKGLETKEFTSKSTHLKDLMEVKQFLKGSWFNEIGLNSLFNMKRESINSSETSVNESALKPYVLDMLTCRKEGIKKVNEKRGTNIEVELNLAWIEEFMNENIPEDKVKDEGENEDEDKGTE